MYISLEHSRTNGFRPWSSDHRPGSNDNPEPDGAVPTAITEPPGEDREEMREPAHRPWIVPGIGGAI